VLLSRPNLAPPSTPSNRATRYKNRSDEKSLSEAPPATKFPGERIIFDELTPIAETPFESSPPVVASPALQQPTGVELPALLQFPIEVLNEQPPSIKRQRRYVTLFYYQPRPQVMTFMSSTRRRSLFNLPTMKKWLNQLALRVSYVAIQITIQTTIAIA